MRDERGKARLEVGQLAAPDGWKQKRPPILAASRFRNANEPKSSARLFAAARNADLFLETLKADRADHDLLADHIARGAVHAHGFGELEVFLDRGLHFRARQILFDPRRIEAGILGGGDRARLVGWAAAAEQFLM